MTFPRTADGAASFSWPESPRVTTHSSDRCPRETRCTRNPSTPRVSATSPRCKSLLSTRVTTTASPWKMLGCMLWPEARNRTWAPRSRSASQTAANCAELRFRMVLRSGTADGLYGRFIGDKFEDGARNCSGDAVQKFQGEPDAFAGVVRHKTSCKQFCRGAARRKKELFIAIS